MRSMSELNYQFMKKEGSDSDKRMQDLMNEKSVLMLKIDSMQAEIDAYKMRTIWGQLKERR